jgi:hypothetical protein
MGDGDRLANVEFIAHAPTDLRLALDVIEKAQRFLDCFNDPDQPEILNVAGHLDDALTAFESAP